MTVEDIIKATNGKLIIGNIKETCEDFCTDTRKIKPGDVYVGLKGEKFNGNEYYKEALEKGAKVAIISGINISKELEKEDSWCRRKNNSRSRRFFNSIW